MCVYLLAAGPGRERPKRLEMRAREQATDLSVADRLQPERLRARYRPLNGLDLHREVDGLARGQRQAHRPEPIRTCGRSSSKQSVAIRRCRPQQRKLASAS